MTINRTKLRTETYRLGAVRLYREDLEAIAKAVAEIGELEITADDFEGNSPFDFAELPEKLSKVQISAPKAYVEETETIPKAAVKVVLTRTTSTVIVTEPDTLTSGVRTRIQEICRARLRLPQRTPPTTPANVTNPDALQIMIIGITIPTAIIALATNIIMSITQQPLSKRNTLDPALQKYLTIGIMSLFAIAICWTTFYLLARRASAIIVNAYQADRPTWWQRNRDNVLVSAVSLLLGGIIGYYVNQIS